MSLREVWEAAASSPFEPAIGKDSQLYVGLLLIFTGTYASLPLRNRVLISSRLNSDCSLRPEYGYPKYCEYSLIVLDRSLVSIPVFGIPASIAFG